jgi:nucleoside 2-deoxyribosyltransferase
MSRASRKIQFEGLLQENVLGTFNVIRGFADLRDLAKVSVAMPYEGGGLDDGHGYQRTVDESHIEDIKRFLQSGRYRFFPEIILSLRSTGDDDPLASYRKRRKSQTDKAYRVSVDLKLLAEVPEKPIRRIDGNHRLEAAALLAGEQRRSSTFKNFATAPFCFVILNDDRSEDDDLTEAMLFNLINSKALPLISEHSLSVLMRDNGAAAVRFAEDRQVYLTRWIRDVVRNWPQGFYDSMGNSPLSRLYSTAKVLLKPGGLVAETMESAQTEATSLFDPVSDLAVRLRDAHESFVLSPAFLPIASEVYVQHSLVDVAKGANTRQARVIRTEKWLRDFAQWFERLGGADLPIPKDPGVLWDVFKRSYDSRAKSVFIAMSFADDQILKDVRKAMNEAIAAFNQAHPNAPLAPVRIDEQGGASYDIPARVFQEIAESGLVIADLTDERPNVYCEIGYAKSRGIPFILTFHKKKGSRTKPPWDRKDGAGNKVHFDLAPFRYVPYDNPMNLRDQLAIELDALFELEP